MYVSMEADFEHTVTIIVTVCGSFSIVGSLLIIFSYLLFKEHRTLSRKLVAWLAVCDFGQGLFFATQFVEERFCRGHAYLGIVTATSSFLWTTAISFFVYTFFKKQALFPDYDYSRILTLFHLVCWGYPFLFVLILFLVEPNITTRGSDLPWCFIDNQTPQQVTWGMFAIYIPLYVSWILTFSFYWLARQRVKQARTRSKNPAAKQELLEVSRKLRLIPLMFVSLRLWGAVYRMIQFTEKEVNTDSMRWLAVMAALGDPSQGTANALVFVIFTKKIRQSYSSVFSRILCCRKPIADEEALLKEDASQKGRPRHRSSISSTPSTSSGSTNSQKNYATNSSPTMPARTLNSSNNLYPAIRASPSDPELITTTTTTTTTTLLTTTTTTTTTFTTLNKGLPNSDSTESNTSNPPPPSASPSFPTSPSIEEPPETILTVPLLTLAASNSSNSSVTESKSGSTQSVFSWRNWFRRKENKASSPSSAASSASVPTSSSSGGLSSSGSQRSSGRPEALNLTAVGPIRESGSDPSLSSSSSS